MEIPVPCGADVGWLGLRVELAGGRMVLEGLWDLG
jgi:hypothetical protein